MARNFWNPSPEPGLDASVGDSQDPEADSVDSNLVGSHCEASELGAMPVQRIDAVTVALLYEEHAEELRCFLLGVLGNLELANEVLQITFAKAVELGHTAHEETIKGWLFRVAYNEALTYRRRQMVRDRAARTLGQHPPQLAESPEDLATRLETIQQVRHALGNLNEHQRQIIRMRIYDEKTYAAIATELDIPLATVYARMQSALRRLRETLHELEQ